MTTVLEDLNIGDRVLVSAGLYAEWLETQAMPKSHDDRDQLLNDWGWMRHVFVICRFNGATITIKSEVDPLRPHEPTVIKQVGLNCLVKFLEEV